jgi:plastocyanin
VIAALVLLGACGGSAEPTSSAAPRAEKDSDAIVLEGLAFDPDTVTVAAGTTITWTNEDAVMHTVTSGAKGEQGIPGVAKGKPDRPDGLFEAELDDAGATFSHTFEESGTYEYFCRIHGGMTGVVVVE